VPALRLSWLRAAGEAAHVGRPAFDPYFEHLWSSRRKYSRMQSQRFEHKTLYSFGVRVVFITTKRPFRVVVLVLSLLVLLPGVVSAADAFDVSYVWSSNAAGVRDYRERVGRVLGPGVAKDLKVVARGDLYGLIYDRRGDSASTARVARAHTRVLKSRGMNAAAVIPARDWTPVDGSASSKPVALASAPKIAAPTRQVGQAASDTFASAPKIDAPAQPVKVAASDTFADAPRIELASLAPVSVTEPVTATQAAARERTVRNLEAAVEEYIAQLRRDGKIAPDERTGWSVYDFTSGQKLVTINEDSEFQTASLIKPFIAAAFLYKVERGELKYGTTSRHHMERMIQHSNNASTNWVARQVGGPKAVEKVLKQQYPGIFRNTHLVEYIPANGRTYRNKASIHDYSRFLYAVWNERIAGAREIKRLMALPGSDRIYTGAHDVPKGTRVYNKTGSTARLCGDMGILSVEGKDGKRYPYTLIGVIEKEQSADNYTRWIRSRSEVIRNVSNIVYRGIAEHHDI
jgi:beta-lactamase class A